MSLIIPIWIKDESFAERRLPLIEAARRHIRPDSEAAREAGAWLDAEYSQVRARMQLAADQVRRQAQLDGQPDLGDGFVDEFPESTNRGLPGDMLRANSLELALRSLYGRNSGEKLRLLGPNQPKEDRVRSAMRAAVVACCVLDPDSCEWLADVTRLAGCPWWDDEESKPWIRGRSGIAERWGLAAADLLEDACGVLGWTMDAAASPPTPDTERSGVIDKTDRHEAPSWQRVQGRLLQMYDRGLPFTSLRKLATELGCAPNTVKKAIGKSTRLTGWQARGGEQRSAGRVSNLNEMVLDRTPQARELDPAAAVIGEIDDAAEQALRRLLEQASAEQLAQFDELPPTSRREMVEMVLKDRDWREKLLEHRSG
jgi:hypothetical protein